MDKIEISKVDNGFILESNKQYGIRDNLVFEDFKDLLEYIIKFFRFHDSIDIKKIKND